MTDNDDGTRRRVPKWDELIDRVAKQKHLRIEDLQADDVLMIVTANHRYAFTILDPSTHRVRVTSDNPEFPGPYVGCFQGSVISPIGSAMFIGRVQIGLRAEWSSPDLRTTYPLPIVVLSATKEIIVNGISILSERTDDTVH